MIFDMYDRYAPGRRGGGCWGGGQIKDGGAGVSMAFSSAKCEPRMKNAHMQISPTHKSFKLGGGFSYNLKNYNNNRNMLMIGNGCFTIIVLHCLCTLSQGYFIALIKVSKQHVWLAVSTFPGPAEERGAESSPARKERRRDNR